MKIEVPIYCTVGERKLLFYAQADEDAQILKAIYKEGGKVIGEVSFDEILLQVLKGRVYISYEKKN